MSHNMIEVERRVLALVDNRARDGLPQADLDVLRAIVRSDMDREYEESRAAAQARRVEAEREARFDANLAAQRAKEAAAEPKAAFPTPVPRMALDTASAVASRATAPPAKVVARVPASIATIRERAIAILRLAPPGAEEEAAEAIRAGMSLDEFKGVLAAREIIQAGRLARGG